ncbi:hypothetical protein SYYSPA8_28350, partial [Streptomyces yaizuensis]
PEQHDPEQHDPEQHDPEQHDPEQHDPEQHDPEQHDPEQHDPEQHDPERDGASVGVTGTPRAALKPAISGGRRREGEIEHSAGQGDVGDDAIADPEAHRGAVAGARTNADAIRYALAVNSAADDSAVVTWLADFGREVNRGQVYKVRQQALKKRSRIA